ncbi:hypothetical protein CC78DRAFT_579995 [Lojkania enalia]|uniref:Uncharacterized protein n=1 Tax=Lojkania enalia TaxID=147567 RepID=A0A9P4KAB0_9PLEO|nr:hypothetical protein CC78DRAFT_579995 [Didymosphaeria enalia]
MDRFAYAEMEASLIKEAISNDSWKVWLEIVYGRHHKLSLGIYCLQLEMLEVARWMGDRKQSIRHGPRRPSMIHDAGGQGLINRYYVSATEDLRRIDSTKRHLRGYMDDGSNHLEESMMIALSSRRCDRPGWGGLLHEQDFLNWEFPLGRKSVVDIEKGLYGACLDARWPSEGSYRGRGGRDITVPLGGLAAALFVPCAAALLGSQNWSSSARAIAGVTSTSAGVSLIPLQSEPGYDALRWTVRALWALTYCTFLTCSYLNVTRNSHLYLFCSLLLTAHFIAGFVGTERITTEGIKMFGPLAASICAALVYIPFRYRGSSSGDAYPLGRSRQEGEQRRRSNSAPVQPRENDGDLGVRAVTTGTLGVGIA